MPRRKTQFRVASGAARHQVRMPDVDVNPPTTSNPWARRKISSSGVYQEAIESAHGRCATTPGRCRPPQVNHTTAWRICPTIQARVTRLSDHPMTFVGLNVDKETSTGGTPAPHVVSSQVLSVQQRTANCRTNALTMNLTMPRQTASISSVSFGFFLRFMVQEEKTQRKHLQSILKLLRWG